MWLGMFWLGRGLLDGVAEQRVLGYPNSGQIDFLVVWPAAIAFILLLSAWVTNSLYRWPRVLGCVSGLALLILVPYLLVYGGGV